MQAEVAAPHAIDESVVVYDAVVPVKREPSCRGEREPPSVVSLSEPADDSSIEFHFDFVRCGYRPKTDMCAMEKIFDCGRFSLRARPLLVPAEHIEARRALKRRCFIDHRAKPG